MKTLPAERIVENVEKFYGFIDKYITGDRKDQLREFYKSIEEVLSLSPASTKVDNHNCFPGGYLDHVLRVTEAALIFEKVWDRFGHKKEYTTEELVFSALNHDLGKLGTNENPVYVKNDSQWHVEKLGLHYKWNPDLKYMRIQDRSLYALQEAGIRVSENEFLAIKLHDGLYDESNKAYYMPYSHEFQLRGTLVYILHQADLMSSKIEAQHK